eukprot:3976363-Pleurochrysis_carterae.AAC.1
MLCRRPSKRARLPVCACSMIFRARVLQQMRKACDPKRFRFGILWIADARQSATAIALMPAVVLRSKRKMPIGPPSV